MSSSMSDPSPSRMRLYDQSGGRLYLNPSERKRFEKVARKQDIETKTLCLCLFYTGCRLSEALAVGPNDIQRYEGIIAIRSLKKRKQDHVREIPIPERFVVLLKSLPTTDSRYWPISRTTAWRRIKKVMKEAGIKGPQATPKGLRHSFGIWSVLNNIHLPIVQRWLGHADIRTTAIYTMVCGPEERLMAARLW